MAHASSKPTRLIYKEIVAGDLLKFSATSNISQTGGGARDLRIRPMTEFLPIIQLMFPETEKQNRSREGKTVALDILKGKFCCVDANGNTKTETVFFEPPTDARPNEGRIARVNSYECFKTTEIFKANDKLFLILIQNDDETVWPYFHYESSFRQKGTWHPAVEKALTDCIAAKRASVTVVMGYYDFTTKKSYCNGT